MSVYFLSYHQTLQIIFVKVEMFDNKKIVTFPFLKFNFLMVGEHEMLTGIIQRMKNFCDTKDLQIKRNHKETSEGRRPHS